MYILNNYLNITIYIYIYQKDNINLKLHLYQYDFCCRSIDLTLEQWNCRSACRRSSFEHQQACKRSWELSSYRKVIIMVTAPKNIRYFTVILQTLRDAPPTRNPSTSGCVASSLQFAPLTEPVTATHYNRFFTMIFKIFYSS